MSKSPDEITNALGAAFPRSAIKQREGGRGKKLDYVEGHTIIHRLIDATGNQFDVRILNIDEKRMGESTLVLATVELTIPGLGTRQHMGVQMVHDRGGEDLVKGAITDALKKAATLFGVGLDLYGPDYEAGEIDDQPVSQRPAPRRDALVRPPDPRRAPEPSVQAARDIPMDRGRESAIQSLHAALAKHGLDHSNAHDYFTMPERGYRSVAEVPTPEIVRLMREMANKSTEQVRAMFPPATQPNLVTADTSREGDHDKWTRL